MCEEEKSYPGLYLRAKQTVRRFTGSNEMPGYETLVKAIVTYKLDEVEHLAESPVKEENSEAQSALECKQDEKSKNVEKQQMLEAMKMARAQYDNVDEFIEELAGIC